MEAPLNASDLHYIGQAVLQLWDENFELRQRLALLEANLQTLQGGFATLQFTNGKKGA
jgi:hypothetical protein